MKNLLPMFIRDRFRPTWQRVKRQWDESSWSSKPPEWAAARSRSWSESEFDAHYQMAGSEFGITQVRSEISELLDRVANEKPKTVVEVGTHKGGNSYLFCQLLRSTSLLVGVDLNVQNAAKLRYFSRPGQRYVVFHGDSQVVAMQNRVRKALAGNEIDFLFIDGDHRYDGVKRDFQMYEPLVRPGGLIGFHDIIPDHRTRFGKETGCDAGEVYRFWAELKEQYPEHWELVENPEQDGFGIGLLRKAS